MYGTICQINVSSMLILVEENLLDKFLPLFTILPLFRTDSGNGGISFKCISLFK